MKSTNMIRSPKWFNHKIKQEMIRQSKFDDLLKYSQGLPIEYEKPTDEIDDILLAPITSDETLPFEKEQH